MNKKFLIISLAILFLGAIPRSIDLLNGNYLFGFDQGRDYLAAKSIVVNYKLTLIGSEIGAGFAGFRGIFHGPFHYYFLSVAFLLFNGNPYGGIVLTFLYGLSSIILTFYLGKRIFGLTWGLIAALLVAISPPLISASRFVWNTHGAVVFILLAFYFVYKIIQERGKNGKDIFLAAFFSGFIYNFQLGIAVPMCLALLGYCFFVLKIKELKRSSILLFGFILAFLPMILFELKHSLVLKGIQDYLFNHKETAVTFKFVELILKEHFGVFLYNFYDTFPKQKLVGGELMAIILTILFFFFFFKERDKHLKYFLMYLLLLPISSFFVFSFLRGAVYPYYLMNLNFVYILLFVYILFSSFRYRVAFLQWGLTSFLVFLLIQASLGAVRVFKNDYSDYGGTHKIKGKIDALNHIYRNAKGEDFGVLVFSPAVYTYPYDYLLWWYGQKKYNYIPHKKEGGLFYLWIEPDPHQPWTYKGWLETVIKTGKILETKELPSGFIIQKRFLGESL